MGIYDKLKEFQLETVNKNIELINQVLTGFRVLDRQITIAPTGAGKTYMMASIIEVALKFPEQPSFVWITHNTQVLSQTNDSIREALEHHLATAEDISRDRSAFGARVLLFNVQKGVSEKALRWLGMWKDYQDEACKPVIFIVDESDYGMSGDNMERLQEALKPSLELGFTASFTGKAKESLYHRVEFQDVIDAGMLVDRVNFEASDEISRLEMLKKAIAQRELLEKKAEYLRIVGRYFIPKLVIQAPAADCEAVGEELRSLLGLSRAEAKEQIAIHIQRSRGLDQVADFSQFRFIVGDMMIERGWNCPEAYVLCSMRQSVSEARGIQLLGRVVRRPQCERFDERFEDFNQAYVYVSGRHAIEAAARSFGGEEITLPPMPEVIQVEIRHDVVVPPMLTFVDQLDKEPEDDDLLPVTETTCQILDSILMQCKPSVPTVRSGRLDLTRRAVQINPIEDVEASWDFEQTKKLFVDALSKHFPRNYSQVAITLFQILKKPAGGLIAFAPYAKEAADKIRGSDDLRRLSESLEYVEKPYEWPPHKLVIAHPRPYEFARCLYPMVHLNNEEVHVARRLDEYCAKFGLHWVRNDRTDVKLFRGHYPDFILFSDTKYIFIESKGKHLLNTTDSQRKNRVGQAAAAYFMLYIDEDNGRIMVRNLDGRQDTEFSENSLRVHFKNKN
jgi:hypothetical protein